MASLHTLRLKAILPAHFSSTFDSLTVMTRAEGKPIQDAQYRTPQTNHYSISCLPAKLPSLYPALTSSTSRSSGPLLLPTFCHLLGYTQALLCPGVGTWPWQHTGPCARLPGEHV